jgi:hypothetical protein
MLRSYLHVTKIVNFIFLSPIYSPMMALLQAETCGWLYEECIIEFQIVTMEVRWKYVVFYSHCMGYPNIF